MKTDKKQFTQPQRQRTSVTIKGIDTSTPDDLVEDGKCEKLHNLRIKDDAWRPVHQHPIKTKIDLNSVFDLYDWDELRVVYHHPAAGEDTYIVELILSNNVSYYSVKDTYKGRQDLEDNNAFIATFNEMMKISHFGNMIFFKGQKDLSWYYFQNNRYYQFIQPAPPKIHQHTQKWENRPPLRSGSNEYPDGGYDPAKDYKYWIDIGNKTTSMPPTHYSATTVTGTNKVDADSFKKVADNINWATTAWAAHWQLASNDGALLIPYYSEEPETDGYFWGEFAYFVCYRMADGTVLSPSPLCVFCTEVEPPEKRTQIIRKYDNGYTYLTVHMGADSAVPLYRLLSPQMQYGVCDVSIEVPTDINTNIITEVCIYSTRINPIFDMGQVSESAYSKTLTEAVPTVINTYDPQTGIPVSHIVTINKFRGFYPDKNTKFADNKLAEQQFYLIHTIPIEAIPLDPVGYFRSTTITIDYYMLRNAESKQRYTPNNNIHKLLFFDDITFNDRLHIFNTKRMLHPTEPSDMPLHLFNDKTYQNSHRWEDRAVLNIDNKPHIATPSAPGTGVNFSQVFWSQPSLYCISYHDYRTIQIESTFFDTISRKIIVKKVFPLVPSTGNNIAYLCKPDTTLKYSRLPWAENFNFYTTKLFQLQDPDIIISNDQILVSSTDNPFSWPFNNTYSVGSNNSKILALQSAAIEMTDSKFGEMPLYAFTEEGVFALQAGESTLYSSVIPINYDKIINPNVLAINYNLVYITEKGVHLLNGNGSQLISSPLDGADGKPLDLWKSIKLLNPQSFNEVICYDEASGTAYIYNMDHQYWSTRDMRGRLINGTESVLEDGTIIDISQENEDTQRPYSVITRPVKLGDLELKRLETIIPRMRVVSTNNKNYNDFDATFYVDAAYRHKIVQAAGANYPELRFENVRMLDFPSNDPRGIVIRRTPYSAKYFRFRFFTKDGETAEIALTNIDLEWYHKFLRKMR